MAIPRNENFKRNANVKNVTIAIGLLLILTGLAGYYLPQVPAHETAGEPAGESTSWTALIPAIVGLPILLCGIWATVWPAANKLAMHVAVTFGLLGALAATGRGAVSLLKLAREEGEFNQRAFVFLAVMAILCWLFVGICIASFVKARRVPSA